MSRPVPRADSSSRTGPPSPPSHPVTRWAKIIIGGVVLLVGIALLVLPGPGMLLVLAGLLILASEIPSLDRYIEPVQYRALAGMEQSVGSRVAVAGTILGGLALMSVGVVVGLRLLDPLYPQWLPPLFQLRGWGVGASFIGSGLVVWGLLVYSYWRVHFKKR